MSNIAERFLSEIESERFTTFSKEDLNELQGEMNSSFRKERSFNGLKMDILKSGIQKMVRRGRFKEAAWFAIEMDLMSHTSGPLKLVGDGRGDRGGAKKSEALAERGDRGEVIRTNLLHRLMIIFLEDLGPAAISDWPEMDRMMNVLFEKRKKRGGRFFDLCFLQSRSQEMETLVDIIWLLTKSEHSRELSHCQNFGRLKSDPKIEKIIVKSYAGTFLEQLLDDSDFEAVPQNPLECEEELETLVDNFMSSLEDRSFLAFVWCSEILEKVEREKIKLKRRFGKFQKSQYLIFDLLQQASAKLLSQKRKKVFDVYLQLAMSWFRELANLKEHTLTFGILIHCLIQPRNLDPRVGPAKEFKGNFTDLYWENLAGNMIEIDESIIDMHTAEGRKLQKDRVDFAEMGSRVENEWTGTNQMLKQLYIDAKLFQEDEPRIEDDGKKRVSSTVSSGAKERKQDLSAAKKRVPSEATEPKVRESERSEVARRETDLFDFQVRVQINCSKNRPDTYIAIDRETGHQTFVKGPYPKREQAEIPFKINQIKGFFEEIPSLEMEVLELIPDLWEKVPLGCRNTLAPGKAYPFLVVEDLHRGTPYPTTWHEPTKLWPETEVVDWERIKKCRVPEIGLMKSDPEAFRSWILNMLFRWVIGIPDCARRNFVYLPEEGLVYDVDEEAWNREAKFRAALRNKTSEEIIGWIENNWDLIGATISKWGSSVEANEEAIKKIMEDDAAFSGIKSRLESISTRGGAFEPFL